MSLHAHELTLGFSFILGAVHALEPGHGKTAMLVYLLDGRRSWWHPVIMGLSTAISHSVSLFAIAFVVHLAHHAVGGDHHHEHLVSQVLQWISAVLVLVVGVWMLAKCRSGKGHTCCQSHEHGEGCSESSTLTVVEPHDCSEHDHPTHSPKVPTSYSTTALLGVAVGLLPCPSALAAYFTGLSTGQPWLAYVIIALFAAGIATSLTSVGLILQFFGERFAHLSSKTQVLPWSYLRAGLVLAIGVYYVGRLLLVPDSPVHVH